MLSKVYTIWMDDQSDSQSLSSLYIQGIGAEYRKRKITDRERDRNSEWKRGGEDSWCHQTGYINICYDLLGTGGIICKDLLEIWARISSGRFLRQTCVWNMSLAHKRFLCRFNVSKTELQIKFSLGVMEMNSFVFFRWFTCSPSNVINYVICFDCMK